MFHFSYDDGVLKCCNLCKVSLYTAVIAIISCVN